MSQMCQGLDPAPWVPGTGGPLWRAVCCWVSPPPAPSASWPATGTRPWPMWRRALLAEPPRSSPFAPHLDCRGLEKQSSEEAGGAGGKVPQGRSLSARLLPSAFSPSSPIPGSLASLAGPSSLRQPLSQPGPRSLWKTRNSRECLLFSFPFGLGVLLIVPK